MERLAYVGVAMVIVAITVRAFRRDSRWLGNAFLIAGSVLAVIAAMAALRLPDPILLAVFLTAVLSPLLVGVLVVALIWNGIDVMRREGPSLAHSLSLLAGLAVIGVMGLAVATVLSDRDWVFDVAVFAVLLLAWFAVLFIGYVLYAGIYALAGRRQRPDYVIALGSGLVRGDQVPPLLAARIDRALKLYRSGIKAGRPPLLVMSGGRGSDEEVAEAEAMCAYAVAHGARRDDVIVESRSRSTRENLSYSDELVRSDPRLGPGAYGVAVTSNYHAMRAAMLARRMGLRLDAVGAPVAWYYWPSAMLREFVAVVREHLGWHIMAAVLVCAPIPLLLAYAQTRV